MHELIQLFGSAEIELDKRLVQMLDEHCTHQTERRGCGFTQATRFLSDFINGERLPDRATDLRIFVGWPVDAIGEAAKRLCDSGWPHGWRRLHCAPPSVVDGIAEVVALRRFQDRIAHLSPNALTIESQLLLAMIQDVLDGSDVTHPVLPPMPIKPKIGSCSQAEEFFLEIAHGKIRRGGWVNVILDGRGEPLLIEKMGLGESHSAILLKHALINGVVAPPGSLLALSHGLETSPEGPPAVGQCMALADIAQARFLRLTTLAVAPEIRKRAFSSQVAAQVRSNMVSPLSTTLDDLRAAADRYAGAMA